MVGRRARAPEMAVSTSDAASSNRSTNMRVRAAICTPVTRAMSVGFWRAIRMHCRTRSGGSQLLASFTRPLLANTFAGAITSRFGGRH